MDRHTTAVIQALNANPCSLRQLAQAAGIDHSLLVHIKNGRRRATPDVATKVAEALIGWGKECTAAGRTLKTAAKRRRRL